ncbi:MAG: cysteine dioxygenase family protein [Planctomycetes bacterium]|nr:cysteine dioxygenase family protein [Planctomycetota bacterium]
MNPSALDQLVRDVTAELARDARGPRVAEMLSRYARGHNDWREFALFDKRSYARNLLHKDELFELILLCWDAGQVTPIHDHRGQRCWMGVLEGRVDEALFDVPAPGARSLALRNTRRHERGAVAFITDDIGLHRIAQVGSEPAVSLHLYSRPIPTCRVFDPDTGVVGERTLTYHSVRGVRVDG